MSLERWHRVQQFLFHEARLLDERRLQEWLALYAEHLENHARQIEANLAAWRAQRGGGKRRRTARRAKAKKATRSRR